MKVLLETTDSQTLSFVPRVYASSVNYIITNETTNTSVTVTDKATTSVSGLLQIPAVFNLESDVFYELEVYDASSYDLIYKDKIFCTNQFSTVLLFNPGLFAPGLFVGSEYSINNATYTSDVNYDNQYIIYE